MPTFSKAFSSSATMYGSASMAGTHAKITFSAAWPTAADMPSTAAMRVMIIERTGRCPGRAPSSVCMLSLLSKAFPAWLVERRVGVAATHLTAENVETMAFDRHEIGVRQRPGIARPRYLDRYDLGHAGGRS